MIRMSSAQAEGKRSRVAFNLTEILNKYNILEQITHVIVYPGCAPGSWSAELVQGSSAWPPAGVYGASAGG